MNEVTEKKEIGSSLRIIIVDKGTYLNDLLMRLSIESATLQ